MGVVQKFLIPIPLPISLLLRKLIHIFPTLCSVARSLFVGLQRSCDILHFFYFFVFVQPTIWVCSSFRPIFVLCRIETLLILWIQQLPLLLSVILEIVVRVEETLICSFCCYCFVWSQVAFHIIKMSVKCFDLFSLLIFCLLSWPDILQSIVSQGLWVFIPIIVRISFWFTKIEMKIRFCSCCRSCRQTKCCSCSRVSAEPIYHSLVLKFYSGLVLHSVRLTNNLVKTVNHLYV